MTVGGRRSGVPSGESRFHANAHVMSLAHPASTGHRQQQCSSSLERAAQGTAALWLAALPQWRRPAGTQTGGGEQAADPTFLIKHIPWCRVLQLEVRRISVYILQFAEPLQDFTSLPTPEPRSVSVLVTILCIFSPINVPPVSLKMTTRLVRRNIRLLVINPNSSHDMTHGMETAIRSMDLPDV